MTNPSEAVTCPFCDSPPGQACRDGEGYPRPPHLSREEAADRQVVEAVLAMPTPDKKAALAAFNAWCLAIRTKLESPITEATMELAKQFGARTTDESKLLEVASWFNWDKLNKVLRESDLKERAKPCPKSV